MGPKLLLTDLIVSTIKYLVDNKHFPHFEKKKNLISLGLVTADCVVVGGKMSTAVL